MMTMRSMAAAVACGVCVACGGGSDYAPPAPPTPAPAAAIDPAPAPDPPAPVVMTPPPTPAPPPPPPNPIQAATHQRGSVKRVEWTWRGPNPTPRRWYIYEYGGACANQPFKDPWGEIVRMRNSDQWPSHAQGWLHVNWTGDSGGCNEVRVCAGNGRRCTDKMRWPGR